MPLINNTKYWQIGLNAVYINGNIMALYNNTKITAILDVGVPITYVPEV